MDGSAAGARLIIVCGLPGSGKTTRAKLLEARHGAVRLSADDWMDDLGLNLWDEGSRARIEALQWKLG
jgi:predicted kinase